MIIILIGAESTATRAFTAQFSRHPEILGTPDAMGHNDILDEVWWNLENGQHNKAREILSQLISDKIILTRRSVPHGEKPGAPAKFGTFPSLQDMIKLVMDLDCQPFVLVTTRSPIPNIMSWKSERASSQGSAHLAYSQYMNCYKKIFETLIEYNTPYFIVSVEQYVLDGENFLKSLYKFFNIEDCDVDCSPRVGVNDRRYIEYFLDDTEININDVPQIDFYR